MTPNDIISEALELQGDTGLTTRARVWLNRIIEHLAYLGKGRPNSWNQKETSITLANGVRTYSLPARMLYVADTGVYIDSSNQRTTVLRTGYKVVEQQVDATTGTGDPPQAFAWDAINSLWVVYPVPTKSGTLKVMYWDRPVDINFGTAGGAELTGSFPHHMLLVVAIQDMANAYQGEEKLNFPAIARAVQSEANQLTIDPRGGRPTIALDNSVFLNMGQ